MIEGLEKGISLSIAGDMSKIPVGVFVPLSGGPATHLGPLASLAAKPFFEYCDVAFVVPADAEIKSFNFQVDGRAIVSLDKLVNLTMPAERPEVAENATSDETEQRKVATRVANAVVTRMLLSELKGARPCALERFAGYGESLHTTLARTIEDIHHPRLGSEYPDIIAMKGKVELFTGIVGITVVLESPDFNLENFAEEMLVAAENRIGALSAVAEQEKLDKDELEYNAAIDEKRGKAIAAIAADLKQDADTAKSFAEVGKIRDALVTVLLMKPRFMKALDASPHVLDAVKKSRERVRVFIVAPPK